MKKGKYEAPYAPKRNSSKKALAMLLTLVLVIGCVAGGTLAWLTATSNEVNNVFTTSDIGVTLEESDNLNLKMVPGWTITKDPKATVTAGSEDCYLFVKVVEDKGVITYTPAGSETTKTTTWSDFLSYEIAYGWTELSDGVYYKIFDSKDTNNTNVMGTDYPVLKDNQVKVKDTVTKEMMNALTDETKPTLTFTAYAVQLYRENGTKFTATEAWAIVNGN